jgi:hypothetical protein
MNQFKKRTPTPPTHTKHDQSLITVVENIVAHFVSHGGFNLRQSTTLQEIVVQRNSLCPGETADVGANPVGLPRGIELVHVGCGNSVRACPAEDWIFDARRSPHPPAFSEATHQPDQRHQQNPAQYQTNRQCDNLVPHPRPECLIQKAILVLAEVAFINGECGGQHRRDDNELKPIKRRLKRAKACNALGETTHPHRPSEPQHYPHYDCGREKIPQEQPIAAFEIGIGTSPFCGGHLRQIGIYGCVNVEWFRRCMLVGNCQRWSWVPTGGLRRRDGREEGKQQNNRNNTWQ